MLITTQCSSCATPGSRLCARCRAGVRIAPPGVPAALVHDGPVRSAVLGLKFRNARRAARELAEYMMQRVGPTPEVDIVTWAPTSARRVADRGYDPAELLARELARLLGRPCRRLLLRERRSMPQAGRDRRSRLLGPRFRARPLRDAPRVLLVDDVVTTGATLREGAAALVRAGATAVVCLAASAAP
ncbi:MAG: hypothetical protein RL219_477 [Actinomycetota bacterium]|jgi:predicted amidophosphoribosyltransferase